MTNTSYRYLFLLLLPLFLLVANSCERSTTEKRILIVQSYEPDFQAYKDIEEAFKKDSKKKAFMPVSSRSILIAKLINRQKRNKEYIRNSIRYLYGSLIS